MADANEKVKKLAGSTSRPPFAHKFVRQSRMSCGLDAALPVYVGDVEYENALCEIFVGIQIADWLFTLEKMRFNDSAFVCAFLGDQHFMFCALPCFDGVKPQETFAQIVLQELWPILDPTTMKHFMDAQSDSDNVAIPWKRVNLDAEK